MTTRTKEEAREWFRTYWDENRSRFLAVDESAAFELYFDGLCSGAFMQRLADGQFIADLSKSPRWQSAQLAAPLVVMRQSKSLQVDPEKMRALNSLVKPEVMLRHLQAHGEMSVIALREAFPNLTPFVVMSQLAFLLAEKKITTFKNPSGILMCRPAEPAQEEPK